MKVEYKKVPGKNWGLHIQGGSRALRDKLVGFVVTNNQWMTAEFHDICQKAGPFIQSDSFSNGWADEESSYLFIEFWSYPERHAEFLAELLKAGALTLSEAPATSDAE